MSNHRKLLYVNNYIFKSSLLDDAPGIYCKKYCIIIIATSLFIYLIEYACLINIYCINLNKYII